MELRFNLIRREKKIVVNIEWKYIAQNEQIEHKYK